MAVKFAQAALKAAVEGLAMSGGTEERQAQPGMMLVPLLRHQRMALAWMSRRETGSSAPWGGILADDQVRHVTRPESGCRAAYCTGTQVILCLHASSSLAQDPVHRQCSPPFGRDLPCQEDSSLLVQQSHADNTSGLECDERCLFEMRMACVWWHQVIAAVNGLYGSL